MGGAGAKPQDGRKGATRRPRPLSGEECSGQRDPREASNRGKGECGSRGESEEGGRPICSR